MLDVCKAAEAATLATSGEGQNKDRYYDVSKSNIPGPNGPIGKLLLLHDITENKAAQVALEANERKYRTFFTTTRDAVFMTTLEGEFLDANEAAASMFGYDTVEELKRVPSTVLYVSLEQRKAFMERVIKEGFVKDMPVTYRRKGGKLINALLTAVVLKDRQGNTVGFQGTIKDITDMKRTEEALFQANERLSELLVATKHRNEEITVLAEMSQAVQSSKDMETAYRRAAEHMSRLFETDSGFISEVDGNAQTAVIKASFGSPAGKTVFVISDCYSLQQGKLHESLGSDPATLCPHLTDFTGYSMDMPLTTAGGAAWLLALHKAAGGGTDPALGRAWLEARRSLFMLAGQELSAALSNVRLRETLREQAIRDPLTGLHNRRYMEEALDRELRRSKRSGTSIGFIMADLDHFKGFNDTYGHEAGDRLLQAVANRIRNVIRVEDIACRYGGEEFFIILPSASLRVAYERALQIRKEVDELVFTYVDQRLRNVTISLGVSAFPAHGSDILTLVRAADQAMYEAKRRGRDRVVMAEEKTG